VTSRPRGTPALAALAAIIVITAAWWALALWPMSTRTPEWLARTRLVCFGAPIDGLPDGGGWILLIGEPLGMMLLLLTVWGRDLREAVRRVLERASGQIAVGVTTAALLAGALGVVARVRQANAAPFAADPIEQLGTELTRINDTPPALKLLDQNGAVVTLDAFRGRAVLVTFAFAHCTTVCPLVVHSVLSVRDRLASSDAERTPAVLVITLDPWRDTPSRLPAIARQWGMTGDAHVLSGPAEDVERALNAWRIPRVRNEKTGDLSHPSLVYVIAPSGRIAYVVNGIDEQILAAVRAL
jgi:protein SCO1/2